jgi:DNA-binding transcriptional LysR family regulator
MDIFRNMHVFVAVAKASSFRRAAEALGLPGSTVSRRIAELEHDVGLRLFNRTTRRVELTEGGRLYFENCQRIVQEAELAHLELTHLQARPSGVIRASLPVDFSVMFLSPVLADFSRLHPGIRFELDLTPAQANLVEGSVDVAIRMGLPKEQNLIARHIASMDCGLYASPAYLAQHAGPATPQALSAHECLRMRDGPWTLHPRAGGPAAVVEVSGRFVANNVGMLRQLALAGLGIMANVERWAAQDVAEGRLVRVLPEWAPPPGQAYALTETRLLPAKVRVFIDYLARRMSGPADGVQESLPSPRPPVAAA